jgi:hypothetical protein
LAQWDVHGGIRETTAIASPTQPGIGNS